MHQLLNQDSFKECSKPENTARYSQTTTKKKPEYRLTRHQIKSVQN